MSPGRIATAGILAAAAVGLTALFWWPLIRGGGLVGGDVYFYYLPQKVIYAEDLARHELPLWNNRAGHGYPIVGESQTGPFYPFHALFYSMLAVNTAYNANHLVHYVLAFVFMSLYARAIGLSVWGSSLAALVYTYGWFPARCSLEWAIIGGAWMPAALWCFECFLTTRLWRFLIGMAGILALQLLAGHFNLAFLTLVTLIPYAALRLWWTQESLPAGIRRHSIACFVVVLAGVGSAYALSAVQILPTWELKRLSERDTPGANHRLAQGSIPIWYWSQMIRPWHWYSLGDDRKNALHDAESELGAPTNQIEAHLYFGLIPLLLALVEIAATYRTRDRIVWIWAAVGMAALLYTTGWFVGLARYIPGFNFFQDPGRYGVITTLGMGILAGKSLDRLRTTGSLVRSLAVLVGFGAVMWLAMSLVSQAEELRRITGQEIFQIGEFGVSDGFVSGLLLFGLVVVILAVVAQQLQRGSDRSFAADLGRRTLTACVLCTTAFDFWLVSRVVKDSQMVPDPPIQHLTASPVRQILSQSGGTSRMLAKGANLPSVLAAATPVYLTFGPAAYVDPKLTMPEGPLPKKIEWLRRAGVTHILWFEPLDLNEWPVKPVWQGADPLLNPALGRPMSEPLYLYSLEGGRGRIAWEKPGPGLEAKITDFRTNRVAAEADSPSGGRLMLTDLMYPGWTVTIDGAPAEGLTSEGMFRAVELPAGRHTLVWSYHPRSLYWGLLISGATLVFLAAVAHVRFWHPQRLNFFDEASPP